MRKSQNECEQEVKSRLIRNLGSSKRGLLIFSLNAPSLRKHKDEIEVLMREIKIDILTLSETKLDSKTEEEQISVQVIQSCLVIEILLTVVWQFTSVIH